MVTTIVILSGVRRSRTQPKDLYSRDEAMREDHYYCVYIAGSISGTLYIGVTGNLRRRMWQHKHHQFEGFTSRYSVDRLLYYERYVYVGRAIAREKQLKGWLRKKKVALIECDNPQWKDLAGDWFTEAMPPKLPS